MNPRAWLASTLARHIEARGELLAEWEDADEMAVPVSTLATFAPLWRTEEEVESVTAAPIVPIVERGCWTSRGDLEERITAYLREHGEGYATMIGREVNPRNVQSARARLCSMWAEGKVVRVGKGRYRLA